MNKLLKKILFGAVILAIAFVLIFNYFISVERIDAGHVGIKVNLIGSDRGVNDITEVTGYIFYFPLMTVIYEFPTYTQSKDYEAFKVNAQDGSEFMVDPTLTYYVKSNSVPEIFRQYRKMLPELENGVIKTIIFDSYRIAANSFTSDSLMSNRGLFETQVQSLIVDSFNKMGLEFQNITSNLDPPVSLKEAIDAKNKATQDAILAENKIRQAEADAKARQIRADVEKYENDLKNSSLSDLILKQAFIDKWDGKLPVYGDSPLLIKDIMK